MIKLKNVSYAYPQNGEIIQSLKNINLEINQGEVIVLCGSSGCGKTTLTRVINGLVPNFYEGELTGEVFLSGKDITKQPLEETAKMVGSVFQNPRSQFFNIDTTGEIIFGCENIGLPKEVTLQRLEEVSTLFNLDTLLDRSIFELSGGEKQRIACASIYAVQPDVFVFDEPSSNLDSRSIELLRNAMETLVKKGKTIVIAEHRLYYLSDLATRYVYMKDSQIEKVFSKEEMLSLSEKERTELGLRGLHYFDMNTGDAKPQISKIDKTQDIYIEKLDVAYDREVVLNIKDLSIAKHSIVALIGENGAGKSTFAKAFVGLQKGHERILLDNKPIKRKQRLEKSYMVMQDVNHQLFTESVWDEVSLNLENANEEKIENTLNAMGLGTVSKRHPQSLSGGQKQRVAIASAICAKKEILIFDEPTSGQDYNHMMDTCKQIKSVARESLCTVVITHDIEFLLKSCDRVIRLDKGEVCEDYILDEAGCERAINYFKNVEKKKSEKVRRKKEGVVSRIAKFAGKYKYSMYMSWLLSALSGVMNIGIYIYLFFATNSLMFGSDEMEIATFGKYGLGLILIASSAFFVYGLGLMFSHVTAFNLISILRKKMIDHLGKVPLSYYSEHSSGELRKTLEKSTENCENFVAHQLPDLAQSMVMPLAFLGTMFYFDWKMSLACIIPIVAGFVFLSTMMGDKNASFIEAYQKALGEMSSAGVEYVRGMNVVKIFGQSVHSFTQFHQSIMDYKDFSVAYVMSQKNPMSLYIASVHGLFFFIAPTGIILYQMSNNPEQALHSFVFFVMFIPLTSNLLNRVMNSTHNLMLTTNALDDIDAILAVPEQTFVDEEAIPDCFDIEFKDVSFSYKDTQQLALNHISFQAKEDTITALVGASGSGKTTITNLIARLWDSYDGEILVGGKPLKSLNYDQWLQKFSFVFQENQLLKMSIADNVSFCSNRNTSEEEIQKALELAQCDDIIAKLPNGIHTIIGEKGVYLSGGEMQRIAIARAILQDAPIILLDEATAFADPENEHLILKALHTLLKGKTVFMIAHRLSVITTADNILVLDKGSIAESGDHKTLMDKKGLYATMFNEYNKSVRWKVNNVVKEAENV